jgi:hypothetical protein
MASMLQAAVVRDTVHRVTIQTASMATEGLMLLTGAGAVGLAGAAIVQVARGSRRAAALLAVAVVAVAAVYGAALVGTGVASRPPQLAPRDAKCFDDWCAALVAARLDAGAATWLVDVQLQNRGRGRAMRSNLARAYLEVPGGGEIAPEDGRALHQLLRPGERVEVPLVFRAPGAMRGLRFVVVEGAGGIGPEAFEIGGEGSPFHARAGWPLPVAAASG